MFLNSRSVTPISPFHMYKMHVYLTLTLTLTSSYTSMYMHNNYIVMYVHDLLVSRFTESDVWAVHILTCRASRRSTNNRVHTVANLYHGESKSRLILVPPGCHLTACKVMMPLNPDAWHHMLPPTLSQTSLSST